MLLYHYTAIDFLDSILEHGLNRGLVVMTPRSTGINAVWLTTDPNPAGHGLTDDRQLTPDERELIYQIEGNRLSPGAKFANKRAIRLTVKLHSKDRALRKWSSWSVKRIEPSWLTTLNDTGVGSSGWQARTCDLLPGNVTTLR